MFASNDNHLLQSKAWAHFEEHLGRTVITKSTRDFSYVAILESTPVGKYLFVPYGPDIKSEKGFSAAINDLKTVAASHGAFFLRIEPLFRVSGECLKGIKAVKVKDIDPAETWVVDLTGDNILAKMPRRLRGYYNTREGKGITITASHDPEDIAHLVRLQAKIFESKNITPYTEKYLKSELSEDFATLYLAHYENKD